MNSLSSEVETSIAAYKQLYDAKLSTRAADPSSRQALLVEELKDLELQGAVTAQADRAVVESLKASRVVDIFFVGDVRPRDPPAKETARGTISFLSTVSPTD